MEINEENKRWIKQIIRRKMITKVKPSKKIYKRKDKKWKKEL